MSMKIDGKDIVKFPITGDEAIKPLNF